MRSLLSLSFLSVAYGYLFERRLCMGVLLFIATVPNALVAYAGPGDVDLFVAFFKSHRARVTPHSPKVCLPGNGWTPESSTTISVKVPGEDSPISVNRYVVTHQEERSLVLYWYQNAHRVMAS